MKLLEELQYRGLISQTTDFEKLDELVESKKIKLYIGFDPTAPSLHHGNLVQIILLKHFQNYGHTPICVVGGATGLIGDPRQSGERKLNEVETVHSWLENLKLSFMKFLEFDETKPNSALIANNYDWTKGVSAIDFLRDIGKNFRLSNMLAKETVAARLNSKEGISFTEFSYQILQAFDYLNLHNDLGVELQCGGNDQWGNLTAGVDLVRKTTGDTVHALTTPIITKADGTKFGKSEGGAIWLDEKMMSPYSFYQFWLNIDDADVVAMLKVFTFLSHEEIERLENEVKENPGFREAQKTLAEEVTKFVHGEVNLENAKKASAALFGTYDIKLLEKQVLDQVAEELGIVECKIGDRYSEVYNKAELAKSNNEFRTAVKQNSLSINNEKFSDSEKVIEDSDLLEGGYILIKKGKKNYKMLKSGK
jgi:tyrosyl-tRNA synthetase